MTSALQSVALGLLEEHVSHCVTAVTEEDSEVPGVTGVDVDLTTGGLTVTSDDPVDAAAVRAAVEEAGYSVAGA